MAYTAALPASADVIRVMAVDTTRMNSELLADGLSKHKRLVVSQSVPESSQILAAVAAQRPDVLLCSSNLQSEDGAGFKVAQSVRAHTPEVKVVLLLDSSEPRVVLEAFRCGARGVFCRSGSLEALAKCIQSIHHGQIWANSTELGFLVEAFSKTTPIRMLNGTTIARLTKREGEVVRCVVDGLPNREIAQRLKLTEHTVKNYLFRIFDKVGVSSRVELILYAFSAEQSEAVTDSRCRVVKLKQSFPSEPKPSVPTNMPTELMRASVYRARG